MQGGKEDETFNAQRSTLNSQVGIGEERRTLNVERATLKGGRCVCQKRDMPNRIFVQPKNLGGNIIHETYGTGLIMETE